MDLAVFAAVVLLFVMTCVAALAGLASYISDHPESKFESLMTAVSSLSFGSAILVCCFYTGNTCYEAICTPIGFCAVGLCFLLTAAKQYFDDYAAVPQTSQQA